jgi:hypothetical protein
LEEVRVMGECVAVRACSNCPGDYQDPDRTARNSREMEEFQEAEEEFEAADEDLLVWWATVKE